MAKLKSVTFKTGGAKHLDVTMKLFALSLEDDAAEWFKGLPDNSFNAFSPLSNAFLHKWGERRDNRYLLAALSSAKRNENETIEELNKRLKKIVQRLHADIKPPEAAILIYYFDSFDGELGFQIREKDPQNLKAAQEESAVKIENNMTASGKTNKPSSSRANTARTEARSRAVNTAEPAPDPITALTEAIKRMESSFTQQNTAMQNRLVQLERAQQKRYPPRGNGGWIG